MRFSIVIPTYRRPRQLAECLQAVQAQDYPPTDFEVVVVSDGPDAETAAVTARAGIRAIVPEHGGPAKARNAGAREAKGDFLLFLDDDCRPEPNWLREWDRHTRQHPEALSGGGTRNALREELCPQASQLMTEFIQGYFNSGEPGRAPFLATNNLCVPAARFAELAGFSTRFPLAAAEDRDFCDRWHQRGWPMAEAPRAVVAHAHHMNLAQFWRQHWNYGRGAWQLRRARQGRQQPQRVEPPGKFYGALLGFAWRHEPPWRAAPLCVLMGLSQVANAAGFLSERRRANQ